MSLSNNFPIDRPTLNLNFARTKLLDPRITFTRTTTARYYNGVTTAKAEENLLLQSQAINLWSVTNTTVGTNTDTAPDGTTTAEAVKEDSATGVHRQVSVNQLALAASTVYTMSVFVKQKTGSRFATIGFSSDGFNYCAATFDLSGGTNTQTSPAGYTGVSATITASVNSWYRVTLTATTHAVSVTSGLAFLGLSATSTPVNSSRGFDSYAGDNTSEILYWGAQLEQRDAVTAYTATTTQPITNYIPVLLTAAAGQARFDHNPNTGESLGLLVEEQRTNLLTYSAQFDNAAWTKTTASITANTVVSPDGALTGDKLIEDTNNAVHRVERTVTISASTAYTFSFYAKAAERSVVYSRNDSTGANANAAFDLTNGTVQFQGSGQTASISSVGNGWYRCIVTATSGVGVTSGNFRISLSNAAVSNDSAVTYTGNGFDGLFIWGAQLEAGAFPTSYIPTVASQQTRNADAALMLGANFASWYNPGEGTLYAEGVIPFVGGSGFPSFLSVDDGTSGDAIELSMWDAASDSVRYVVWDGGTAQASIALATYTANSNFKLAGVYKLNDFAASYNGGAAQTDTSGTLPIVNLARIGQNRTGGNSLNGTIKRISYYPERLTNAQLQALTS